MFFSVFLLFLCVLLYLQKLRTFWSKRLGELAKDVFLSSVPAQSKLSAERCEKLWLDLEQELVAQLQQAECTTKLQLEDMRAQLDKDRQVNTMWWIINKYFTFILKHCFISLKSRSIQFNYTKCFLLFLTEPLSV